MPYKREVQPRLDTSTGQVNGERGTIGDLQTERLSLDRGKQVNFFLRKAQHFLILKTCFGRYNSHRQVRNKFT